ncbi:MAG: flagellar hook-basal body complex protein, partial [Gammaproteobacteria bacterium]|nr:flagellar hook-basal body complex protein [Gammaproteobacteria bacterium]
MFNALWVAKTGMEAQDFRVSTISNNLANAATTAFKKDLAHFTSLGYTQLRGKGATTETGTTSVGSVYVGHGVQLSDTSKVHSQGSIKDTESDTDFMVGGEGYFVLVDDAGELSYTRDGHFELVEDPAAADSFNLVHVATNLKLVAVNAETGGVSENVGNTAMQLTPPGGATVLGPMTLDRTGEMLMETTSGDVSFATPQFLPLARFGAKDGLVLQPGNIFKDDAARTGGATYYAGRPDAG